MNRALLIEKLDALARKSFYQLKDMRPYRQRLRSIIRRLKRCPMCAGRGFEMIRLEFFGKFRWMSCDDEADSYPCRRCNGTGRIA